MKKYLQSLLNKYQFLDHDLISEDVVFDNKILLNKTILGYWQNSTAEYYGHPEKYKKNDIIKYPQKIVIAEEIWNKDLKKTETAHNRGYKIIYLWEKEINQIKQDIDLQQFLLNKLYQI